MALNGSVSTMSRLIRAAVPVATPMPTRTSRFCWKPPRAASPKTTTEVTAAPANAAPATLHDPARGTVVTRSTAPSAAPPETPRTPGSASGLRVTAWTSVPARARAAPARSAARTRGTRVSRTNVTVRPALPCAQFTTSPSSSLLSPSSTAAIVTPTTTATSAASGGEEDRPAADAQPVRRGAAPAVSRARVAITTRNTAPTRLVTTPVGTATAVSAGTTARSSTSEPSTSAAPMRPASGRRTRDREKRAEPAGERAYEGGRAQADEADGSGERDGGRGEQRRRARPR